MKIFSRQPVFFLSFSRRRRCGLVNAQRTPGQPPHTPGQPTRMHTQPPVHAPSTTLTSSHHTLPCTPSLRPRAPTRLMRPLVQPSRTGSPATCARSPMCQLSRASQPATCARSPRPMHRHSRTVASTTCTRTCPITSAHHHAHCQPTRTPAHAHSPVHAPARPGLMPAPGSPHVHARHQPTCMPAHTRSAASSLHVSPAPPLTRAPTPPPALAHAHSRPGRPCTSSPLTSVHMRTR